MKRQDRRLWMKWNKWKKKLINEFCRTLKWLLENLNRGWSRILLYSSQNVIRVRDKQHQNISRAINLFLVSYQTPMRKQFVSRDVKRQHCLGDEFYVKRCCLLFCHYTWTQFYMCRTKVNPYFGSKYLGLFLIHSTEGSGYTENGFEGVYHGN